MVHSLKAHPEALLIFAFPFHIPRFTLSDAYNKQSLICLSGTGAETYQQLSLQSSHVLSHNEQRQQAVQACNITKQSYLHSIFAPIT